MGNFANMIQKMPPVRVPKKDEDSEKKAKNVSARTDRTDHENSAKRDCSPHGRQRISRASSRDSQQEHSEKKPERVYREPGTESSKLLQDLEYSTGKTGTDLTLTYMLSP